MIDDVELRGVVFRNNDKVNEFVKKYNCKKVYGFYDVFFIDDEIDIVYIVILYDLYVELVIRVM